MNKRLLLYWLLMLLWLFAAGQIHPSAGAWSGKFLTATGCVEAPASLPFYQKAGVQLLHTRPFLAEDISSLLLFGVLPLNKSLAASFYLSQLQFDGFRQLHGSIGLGRKLSDHWFLGVAGIYERNRFGNGEKNGWWRASAVLRYQHNDIAAGLGLKTADPYRTDRSILNEIYLACGKDFSDQLYADLSLHYLLSYPISLRSNLIYRILDQCQMAIAVETLPFRYAVEIGYVKKQWQILLLGYRIPGIGWTPGLRIGINSPQKKQP